MKIENEKDFKTAEMLIQSFKKAKLNDFTGAEAYLLVNGLEWLVKAMSDFKVASSMPPAMPKADDPTKNTPITTSKTKKNK